MQRIRSRLTYANVMATIAVFVALGGGAYAAVELPKNSVGPKQLKKHAVTGRKIASNAVTGSKVKNDSLTGADVLEGSLAKVPQAAAADTATQAGSANTAISATSATSAGDSAKLGGVAAGEYRRTTAQPGDVLRGAFSVRYPANTVFVVASGSFPVPLPAGTAAPTYHYVAGSSDGTCPGIGQAPAGVLCLYGYNSSNLGFASTSGSATSDPQRLYGWSFDATPTTAASGGFIIGSWAYQVP